MTANKDYEIEPTTYGYYIFVIVRSRRLPIEVDLSGDQPRILAPATGPITAEGGRRFVAALSKAIELAERENKNET